MKPFRALLPLLLAVFTLAPATAREPLNVILILADDLGFETITANGGES